MLLWVKNNHHVWVKTHERVEYSPSFRVQRIHFCDSEPVQHREEWFECRCAFYGASNVMFVHWHLTDLLDIASRCLYFVRQYLGTNGYSGPDQHHYFGRVSQYDRPGAWSLLCI